MGTTAFKTLWCFGQRPPIGNASENPDVTPGAHWGGMGYPDGRLGWNVTRLGGIMWYGWDLCVIDQVPAQLHVDNIGASSVPVSGTLFPLVSSSGAGVTVLAAPFGPVWPSGNIIPTGAIAIDGNMGLVEFGNALPSTGHSRTAGYDPTKAIARAVRVVSAGNDSSGTFLVSGWDIYGYPMTQLLTGASGAPGTATTLKAFKWVGSVLPGGTMSGSAITVGTTDIIGFPVLCNSYPYMRTVWNNASITVPTGFVAPDVTVPSTNLLGDVRGTYQLQTAASNGTLRLTMFVSPAAANANSIAGLFGQPQV